MEKVTNMATMELISEAEWFAHVLEMAEENGDGISTKETIRDNEVRAELQSRKLVGTHSVRQD
jgi:hypothetical protein